MFNGRYVPFLADIFNIAPLDWNDWMIVLAFSVPVIIIDEILKAVGRADSARQRRAAAAKRHRLE